MPTLAAAEASNATFCPTYIPVAVIVGGTSGVGQGIAEAFARLTNGRAHIVIIGRSATTAKKILARFPKPTEADGWAHEFVPCDASSMATVRIVCAGLRARIKHINFLVITAAGPAANSMTQCGETAEGLDNHLAMRYFARYFFTKELLPLLVRAQEQGQHAHMMTVLGAGFGAKIPTEDLGLVEARRRTINVLRGVMLNFAAMKGVTRGVAYNDGMVAWFASQYPELAFTHISPWQVETGTDSSKIYLGWLLAPLGWLATRFKAYLAVSQDECAQYMLHALLEPERGVFIRSEHGDVISSQVFSEKRAFSASGDSPTAHKAGVLHGVPMKGYGGSDASVAGLIAYTEEVLAGIP
ncbi:hypothetical protein C8R43DRAFT_1081238 [Mycena crocata]|nr:hypothetical protein C8R43DRAFT_1081238 [Mycena crocata]